MGELKQNMTKLSDPGVHDHKHPPKNMFFWLKSWLQNRSTLESASLGAIFVTNPTVPLLG